MRTFEKREVRFVTQGQHWYAYAVIAIGPRGGETVIGTYYNETDAVNLVQELRQAERGAIR
jgi:hypothetical protein